ncbi:MAG: hypothetical protein M1434_15570 [Chloroflexi bacterium]|nr:hypothetical protein [Chloroflexota bacterium]MCL5276138.1 hypothetical protein [Chloroflexota bacterium]
MPQATEQPAATAESKSNAAASGGDTRSIDSLNGGLEKLKSYRLHVVYNYDGKNAKGETDKGGIDLLQEIASNKDQHMKFSGAGGGGSNDAGLETFQIGGVYYLYNATAEAGKKCTSYSSGQQDAASPAALFNPSDMLGGLNDVKLVQKGDNVNGVAADHYAAAESSFNVGLFTNAKGDVWVAQDGGYVVKYTGQASGKAALLGGGVDGAISWEYNVEDANKIDTIALPPECAASRPADDIPVPDNATEKGNIGNIITFKSPDDPAKVTDFYKQALPGKGWTAGEGSMEGMLTYTKDKRTLTVMIAKEDNGGSNVVITDAKTQ